jgi:prepilin-type processing-associated H-X9-DG protein
LLQVPIYLCPVTTRRFSLASFEYSGSNQPLTASYAGNMGPKDPNSTTYQVDYTGTSHGGIALQGVLGMDTSYKIQSIKDGTSNTLLVGEISWDKANHYRAWSRGCWRQTNDWNCHSSKNVAYGLNAEWYKTSAYGGKGNYNDVSFGSQHTAGANFALCDGSVRFVHESTSPVILRNIASRNGGEVQVLD